MHLSPFNPAGFAEAILKFFLFCIVSFLLSWSLSVSYLFVAGIAGG